MPALDFDRLGNLWVANEGTESPLKMLDAQGEWHVFGLEGLDVSTRIWQVFATQSDQVWLLLGDGEGVAVLSTGGTPSDPTDDDIPHPWARAKGGCPVVRLCRRGGPRRGDLAGHPAGTGRVLSAIRACLAPDPIDAQQILIEQDGNFQLLLETKSFRTSPSTAGNRKWLATVNNGVFLLSPDGREQVAHFTAANSPLPTR